MAINFPASPTLNQTFSSGNVNYVWDGTKWTASVTGGISLDKIEEGNTSAEVIDTGSDGRFVVTTEGTEKLRVDSNGDVTINDKIVHSGDTNTAIRFPAADVVSVETNGTERARIDSSGRLLVGTTSAPTTSPASIAKLVVSSNTSTTSEGGILTLAYGTTAALGFPPHKLGQILFTDSTGGEFGKITCEFDGTTGSNDYPGRIVLSTTSDGANSPTERMRIDKEGNAVFKTDDFSRTRFDNISGNVYGILLGAPTSGIIHAAKNGGPVISLNRTSSDGSVVDIIQDGTVEGTISVSGTTVSYNGAHLSRWSQLPGGTERTEILRGTVLSNIDEMCEWGEEDNEQLNRMKVSDVEGDPNVSGVFQAWDDDDDTYTDDFYCAMTGDFIIRISAGIPVHRGQLLMSAGDGTAKPQDDDIVRSKTIAKVTSNHVTCTYDDGSYCVPCVLMAC